MTDNLDISIQNINNNNQSSIKEFIKKRKTFLIKQKLKHSMHDTNHFIQENNKDPLPGITLTNDIICKYSKEPSHKQVAQPSFLSDVSRDQEKSNKMHHQQ